MKNSFLISVFLFLIPSQGIFAENISINKKNPYVLLTDDYGILSDADLLKNKNSTQPDTLELQLSAIRWQCFPLQKTKYNYSTWKDVNPWGGTRIIDLCLLRFQFKDKEIIHEYYDRRARPIEFCRALRSQWKKLTKNQKYVCFHGYFNSAENKNFTWTWNKLKTKLGCESLFVGDCDTGKR